MPEFRYRAFISYSWADAAWANWLHRAIETYRTPTALVGKETASGPVPARLQPLFRDREDEAAGSSIGAAIEAALSSSEFLIVICSPRSAGSQWVNREIAWFKTHRDPTKILALIIEGEPGSPNEECFPPAFVHRIAPDLSVTGERVDDPLAADARPSGDGRRRAQLKLIAAMLGVGLDELVRRDDRRRATRARWVTAASLILAILMSALAWTAVVARNEAQRQRAEADGLVEFMLTDLRAKLEPVGRIDALDAVGQRALAYYAGQKLDDLDADALGRRSRAQHLVGELRDLRGDSGRALDAFREAAVTTEELLERDPMNGQRIFDHAQSVYWVGYVAYQRRQASVAEAQFREYKTLADRLAKIDPYKPEWRMEVAYAESNLGTLFLEQGRYDEAEQAFSKSLAVIEALARRDPSDIPMQINVGQKISWLGTTLENQGRSESALAAYQREIDVYRRVMSRDPSNTTARFSLAVAWSGIGRLHSERGDEAAATAAFHSALAISERLRSIEPDNTLWRESEVNIRYNYGKSALQFKDNAQTRRQLEIAKELLARLVSSDSTNEIWNIDQSAKLAELEAGLLVAEGKYGNALVRAEDAAVHLARRTDRTSMVWRANQTRVNLMVGDLQAKLGRPDAAHRSWQTANRAFDLDDDKLAPSALPLVCAVAQRLGETSRVEQLQAELQRRGGHRPCYPHDFR